MSVTRRSSSSRSARVVIASLGVVAVGCGGAHLAQLKEAASADLNCSTSRVHILNSGKTRDVEACGQRATYHWEDGDWRMIARSGGSRWWSAAGHEVVARRSSAGDGAHEPADGHSFAAASALPPPPGGKSL